MVAPIDFYFDFSSPYIVIDDEAFWGVDRLEQVEKWLASGGWKY